MNHPLKRGLYESNAGLIFPLTPLGTDVSIGDSGASNTEMYSPYNGYIDSGVYKSHCSEVWGLSLVCHLGGNAFAEDFGPLY